MKNAVHVFQTGRVESKRLVELVRVLPSRKEGMRCRARCRPEGAGARARESGGGKGVARAEDLTVEGWCGRARAVSARKTYASFQ